MTCDATIHIDCRGRNPHACSRPDGHDGMHRSGIIEWARDERPAENVAPVYRASLADKLAVANGGAS